MNTRRDNTFRTVAMAKTFGSSLFSVPNVFTERQTFTILFQYHSMMSIISIQYLTEKFVCFIINGFNFRPHRADPKGICKTKITTALNQLVSYSDWLLLKYEEKKKSITSKKKILR